MEKGKFLKSAAKTINKTIYRWVRSDRWWTADNPKAYFPNDYVLHNHVRNDVGPIPSTLLILYHKIYRMLMWEIVILCYLCDVIVTLQWAKNKLAGWRPGDNLVDCSYWPTELLFHFFHKFLDIQNVIFTVVNNQSQSAQRFFCSPGKIIVYLRVDFLYNIKPAQLSFFHRLFGSPFYPSTLSDIFYLIQFITF